MVKTRDVHEKLFLGLCAFCADHAGDMPAEELLAVLSLLVGRMVAFQDQRRFSPEAIMALVSTNIEAGNKGAIDALRNQSPAGHA